METSDPTQLNGEGLVTPVSLGHMCNILILFLSEHRNIIPSRDQMEIKSNSVPSLLHMRWLFSGLEILAVKANLAGQKPGSTCSSRDLDLFGTG